MPSLADLLTVLAGALAVSSLVSPTQIPAAALTFVIGVLAFAMIPGMHTHVLTTASAALMLAVAVNASGFQLAAAFAGWLGGIIISSSLGIRSLYLADALLTVAGLRHPVLHTAERPDDLHTTGRRQDAQGHCPRRLTTVTSARAICWS